MRLTQKKYLIIGRLVFITLILLSLISAISIGKSINIDTDLADVSPKSNNPVLTEHATSKLSASIEKRITLLISGTNEDDIFDAQDQLNGGLTKIHSINLQASPDELSEKIINELKPYRFSLLNEKQRSALLEKTTQQIAQESKAQRNIIEFIRLCFRV